MTLDAEDAARRISEIENVYLAMSATASDAAAAPSDSATNNRSS
jgi:hypothetical protein